MSRVQPLGKLSGTRVQLRTSAPEKTKFKQVVCNSGVPCEKRVPSCINPELRDDSVSAVSVNSSADVVTRLRIIQ